MTTIALPYPHTGQQMVARGMKRHTRLVAGRRWFKSSFACSYCIAQALKGERIIWGAPIFDQVRVAYDWIERAAYGVMRANQSRMEMKFDGGGSVLFRSFDNPDSARSHTANGVVMDEAADLDQKVWVEVLRPMLITTRGWSLMLGTPKGINWLHREYAKGLDKQYTDYASFQAPTLGCRIVDGDLIRVPHPLENPTIPFEEIKETWKSMPERVFRQEILAEFVDAEGSVFRGVRDVSTLDTAQPIKGHYYIFGVDWAKSADFTCVCVFDMTTMQQVELDRFNQIGWDVQRHRIETLYEKWDPMTIWAEENSIGSPNIEALQNVGLPVQGFFTSQSSKDMIISALTLAIESKQITLLNDEIQISELEAYQATRSLGGGYRYSAPEGGHDDTVIALALAVHASLAYDPEGGVH